MFYSRRAHAATIAAYERTIAILHEQLRDTRKQLDASLTREAAAREDAVRVATAAAFPRYPDPPAAVRPPAVRQRSAMERTDLFAEVPWEDPSGSFRSVEEASLLTTDEATALQRALGSELGSDSDAHDQ